MTAVGSTLEEQLGLLFQAHPWHGVSAGEKSPEVVTSYIEIVPTDTVKYDAITGSGIEVVERVPIPEELVPPDAQVEIEAKKAAGYYTPEGGPDGASLDKVKGRDLEKF